MKAYLFIMKNKIQTVLSYRFDVIMTILMQCVTMLAICYFWIALYGDSGSMLDVSKKSMLTYATISILMNSLLTMNVQQRIIDSIRNGNVALDILKPINIYISYLAEDLGEMVVSIFQKAAPLLLISSFMFGLPKPKSFLHFLLFLISFICAYFINWFLAAFLGLWAFRSYSLGAMGAVKTYLIKLLSGSIIPIWYFPHGLQVVLGFLPFVSIYQLPLGIYIGKYSPETIWPQMLLQIGWVLFLWITFALVQRKMTKQVLIQGG